MSKLPPLDIEHLSSEVIDVDVDADRRITVRLRHVQGREFDVLDVATGERLGRILPRYSYFVGVRFHTEFSYSTASSARSYYVTVDGLVRAWASNWIESYETIPATCTR